jgi:tetratricopeptide (TPR) repeat protein
MPHVEGESLRSKLNREKQLPLDEAITITQQVAAALDYAHQEGVIHRDIKPENILIHRGEAVVADFGIALAVTTAGAERLTETGLSLGTPEYMSPEQGAGSGELDGRSDVYSLGAVLYEMLTGEPPHTGPTAQAVIAKLMSEKPAAVRLVRDAVPESIDASITKALAKVPADRFSRATEFAEALQAAPVRARTWTRRLAIPIGVAALIALLGGLWTVLNDREPPASAVSPMRVAVFPARVAAADSLFLREALADLLYQALDGAGELRGVDPNAVIPAVRGRTADITPEEAGAIAQRLGAGRYVLTRAVAVGGRLRVNSSLYELERGVEPQASTVAEGVPDSLAQIVSDLARGLVSGLPVGTGAHLSDLSGIRTENYAALKAYLEGEQALRRPDYGEAIPAFERAIEEDSSFALAWFRRAIAIGWVSSLGGPVAAEEALRHRAGLSERDSLTLFAAHAQLTGDPDEADRLTGVLLARYPDHVEGWYLRGMTGVWYNWRRGQPITLAREPFERAIALDSGHTQALTWLMIIYRQEGRHPEAYQMARRSSARQSPAFALTNRAYWAFTLGGPAAQQQVVTELSRANDYTVNMAVMNVASGAGRLPEAARIAELLTDSVTRPSIASRSLGYLNLAHLEAAQGRWGVAKQYLDELEGLAPEVALAYRSLLAVTPFLELEPSELQALRDSVVRWDGTFGATPPIEVRGPLFPVGIPTELADHIRTYLLGLIHARLGDDATALTYAQELTRADVANDSLGLLYDAALNIQALSALAHDDPAAALEILERARLEAAVRESQVSHFHQRFYHRLLRAEALYELGRDEEALGWFGTFPGPGFGSHLDYTYLAYIHLRRGQLYERLGDAAKAVDHYAKFVEMWADAQPELQPLVEQARGRIAALRGEPGGLDR